MKSKKFIILILSVLLILVAVLLTNRFNPWSDSFEDASLAYREGEYAEAIRLFKISANKGNVEAQSMLGVLYSADESPVPKNYNESMKWYKMAAAQGDKQAKYQVALYSLSTKNYEEALKWFGSLASEKDAAAQYWLGLMHEKGEGTEKSDSNAAYWYKKSAINGDVKSQFKVASMYHSGKGVPQNNNEAVKFYKMAASQGNVGAQYTIGIFYEYGALGFPINNINAYVLYTLALREGEIIGVLNIRDNIKNVSRKMPIHEINLAEKLVNNCLRKNFKGCVELSDQSANFNQIIKKDTGDVDFFNLQPINEAEIAANVDSGIACWYKIKGETVFYSDLTNSIIKTNGVIIKMDVSGEESTININKKENLKIEQVSDKSIKITKDEVSRIIRVDIDCGD